MPQTLKLLLCVLFESTNSKLEPHILVFAPQASEILQELKSNKTATDV